MSRLDYVGVALGVATFASLLLPWWSIRASGVSIDVYPYGVVAWRVTTSDWVVDRLLSLNSTLIAIASLVAISGSLAVVGGVKFRPLLAAPVVLNPVAAFIFYRLMRSALGKLALWPESGTNLTPIPGEPWGFALGIGLCVVAGIAMPAPLIASILRRKQPQLCGD